ncbi:MvaI/BcnI family restriction endonuclease [Alkalimonas delamerensis]|uniref:MvaI/BcnI family restriction endonuclease n=1 Tax=Alkalimonas delamerensis TaxID=265981 RepID=A0ABT9GKD7_9GAMM|nr:MvaI/BcnI family restriction endonuclease [Alkalimonas delamerensis]MDP4527436.1 MvaI/BcnI family restriction endonuclease [Alkalimonas delamerensis]
MKSFKSGLPSIARVKQRAKQLKKKENISQAGAYKRLSEEYGFCSWAEFRDALLKAENTKPNLPLPSINFTSDEDVEMTDEDYEALEIERSSDLPKDEKALVIENRRELAKLGVEFSVFEPTVTGLRKSILDATQPVRTHFELEDFHIYDTQGQGQDHKVKKQAFLLSEKNTIKSSVSLYRPVTKSGDPRMWFSKLPQYCEAGDQIAIVVFQDALYLINLSKVRLSASLSSSASKITQFLHALHKAEFPVTEELLDKLRTLAMKPLKALRSGSTGVGYTIETMLGIAANSSKDPDYKGIEIKSGRGNKTRSTLFAQVPNWELSPCKKSAEILNKYGYEREGDFKLYCTVSTQKENSQGLSFIYDESKDELQEWYMKTDLVAVWPGKLLRQRLKAKHSETFWVHAESELIDGVEYFHLKSVTHTKAPILSQLLPLVQAGVVTMDHLIKRSSKNNRVSEKGPLFKMNKNDLSLLFPKPRVYDLQGGK